MIKGHFLPAIFTSAVLTFSGKLFIIEFLALNASEKTFLDKLIVLTKHYHWTYPLKQE